ncbi:unnamed protein product [Schistosoma margrebowiei]|uniref:Uncharacterized protein n=1 Tax=Schistosoma margrebowiei TaxID=48269 RepID=A0A3P7VNT4_9TREM|nr:unnamed protein product [Schistosoma margrebowiei]
MFKYTCFSLNNFSTYTSLSRSRLTTNNQFTSQIFTTFIVCTSIFSIIFFRYQFLVII